MLAMGAAFAASGALGASAAPVSSIGAAVAPAGLAADKGITEVGKRGGRRFHSGGGRRHFGGRGGRRHFGGGGGRRHYGRSYRRGNRGLYFAAPFLAAPFLYGYGYGYGYGDYGYGYGGSNYCYRECRYEHGPRYCRRYWRRYC